MGGGKGVEGGIGAAECSALRGDTKSRSHLPLTCIVGRRTRDGAASFRKIAFPVAKSTLDFRSFARFAFRFRCRLEAFDFLQAAGRWCVRKRGGKCLSDAPIVAGCNETRALFMTLDGVLR